MRGLFTRSIRPELPNSNDPAANPPASVGPPDVNPGDPHGVMLTGEAPPAAQPPRIRPSAWSGWPADWWTPHWSGGSSLQSLTDTAWMCLDLNASIFAAMPPYLVNARTSLNADWLNNPDPDVYVSWEEFAKTLLWDYQLGEVFIHCTARYATGYPARFHIVPPWYVNVEIDWTVDGGIRRYTIGGHDVTQDLLHIRYQSTVGDAHGHGPLEAGAARVVAAEALARYAASLVTAGGIPSSVLEHPDELTADQAAQLQAQWVQARISAMGEPAVLSGGVTWKPTQMNAQEMALVDLAQLNDSRIAYLLGVPAFLVGLPSPAGESMTYKNVTQIFASHWRAHLRPKAQAVMSALSGWLLPRGVIVEVNRDTYIEPEPLERAQTQQILNSIVDQFGNPAMTVEEIRAANRLEETTPDVAQGVLRG